MKLFRILCFTGITVLCNACQKEYSVEHGNELASSGNWEFMNGTAKYSGDIDTVFQHAAGSTQELFLKGKTKDGSQDFELHVFSDSFKIGTYPASAFQSSFLYTAASGKTIYQASQLNGEFTVQITGIGDGNISGTFSGTAKDSSGHATQLTDGQFDASFPDGTVNPGSSGVLGDSSGNCTPILVFGAYAAGIAVNNTNSIQVQVSVTVPGAYTITAGPVNGLSFSKTGMFSSAGPQNVLLSAEGTPTMQGDQHFVLHYGNSQCSFNLPVLGNATGSLGSGGGSCTSFTLAGTYQQGIAFNAGNTVQVQVNATTPGSYHISSNSLNGVGFSGSGIFTAAGLHQVTLAGTGTPENPGLQTFSVSFGTSTCSFPVTFISATSSSGDYFPTTLNSTWSYSLVNGAPTDGVSYTIINYSPTYGGKAYSTIEGSLYSTFTDSFYYRKPGGDYFQYVNFSKLLGFDQFVGSEFIFLKDNVGVSATWNSPVINGTIGGIPVSGFAKMTILAKGVTETSIPGFNFPDVIKVQYDYFINGVSAPVLTQERWFAKNVGEIYFSSDDGTSGSVYEVNAYTIF